MKRRDMILITVKGFGLVMLSGCKNPFKSDPDNPGEHPEPVKVVLTYHRIYDKLDVCPALHAGESFYDEGVYLNGNLSPPPPDNKLEKIGDDLFQITLEKVHVNYPRTSSYDPPPYEIFVVDNVWFDPPNQHLGCHLRAHKIKLNDYLTKKIHQNEQKMYGEYLLVRIDKDGVPHEVDR